MHYIVGVYNDMELEGLPAVLRLDNATELEDYVGMITETLHAKGKAEGMVVGKADGLGEWKAETLVWLMKRRFGPLPGKHRQRIAAAKKEQIEKWFDAAIDAPDLEAVFVSDTQH